MFRVFRVVFDVLVVGCNFWFGWTKTTPKCDKEFDSDTLSKNAQNSRKFEVWTKKEVKSEMEFRAKNSKGVDKNRQNATWSSGV